MTGILATRMGAVLSTAFVTCLISTLFTAIGFWLKSLCRRMEKQEDSFHQLEKILPVDYVRRDDFVRWSVKIDKKIDDLFKLIQRSFKGED